eukprot:CAMPEP_0168544420 /NCGR_PEP_ID=MMETSP0413-20121227/2411_1 /TAXON_ID=136452 /ORGANISM="Filamoeba nolandi, Strain NC-AS-23-1" /LENGTH=127 /DNA_ID=CAMNT_0008574441 /DNA_START=291 /DNA_END=671 /DNA_ORIENTATION=-
MTSFRFHILLLQPEIPRNSTGISQVHLSIDKFGAGLWIGVSRQNFARHTWLGDDEDSWGWGNHCPEFYWNWSRGGAQKIRTELQTYDTGDIVSMKVDMKSKTLQYMKNGEGGCLLDLNKIPGEDPLH